MIPVPLPVPPQAREQFKKMTKIKEKKAIPQGESKEKAEFRRLMEVYSRQNPVKFALKKAALEKRLASL